MRLVSDVCLSDWERRHAWPREQALELMGEALWGRQAVEGLDQLRAGLLIDLDSEVLDQIEQGEWWLIRPEADYLDWGMPLQAFDPKVLALMHNPPAQPARRPSLYRLVESVTSQPLVNCQHLATVDGETARRRTDGEGITHLWVAAGVLEISMQIKNA
ncbi:hypothetical protein QIW53_24725 [Pseudomonas fluorescens]|uniref:hypothetical protein n=1 Tax=Pseudomonas fluorescens TaxID=294 RepID=UPI0035250BF9